MEYTKEENLAYNIHLIKTKKFKKNCIKINFKSLINKEEERYFCSKEKEEVGRDCFE